MEPKDKPYEPFRLGGLPTKPVDCTRFIEEVSRATEAGE